jgi:hypothetical protein
MNIYLFIHIHFNYSRVPPILFPSSAILTWFKFAVVGEFDVIRVMIFIWRLEPPLFLSVSLILFRDCRTVCLKVIYLFCFVYLNAETTCECVAKNQPSNTGSESSMVIELPPSQ